MLRFVSLFLLAFVLVSCSSNSETGTADNAEYDFSWYNPELAFEERVQVLIDEMTIEDQSTQP